MLHNRQNREAADVEMSRLSSQLECARAATAAATGHAGQAEAAAHANLEAALQKQVQVRHASRATVGAACRTASAASECLLCMSVSVAARAQKW